MLTELLERSEALIRKALGSRETRTTILLFLVALVLYIPGIWWAVPRATAGDRVHTWAPDEIAPMGFGELYFVLFSPNPRFDPRYPLFHYLVQALACGPYLLLLLLTGQLSGFSDVYPYGLTNPVRSIVVLTILGRIPSLLMAAGTVVAAYHTARLLWGHRRGLVAGAIVLLMHPMFYYARTANVDMAALLWTSLGLAVFAAILRDRLTKRRAAWMGLFAALSVATKDPGYAAFLPLVPVIAFRHLREQRKRGAPWQQACRPLIIGSAVALSVYVLASGLVLNLDRYLAHVDWITHGSPEGTAVGFYHSTPATFSGYVSVVGRAVECLAASLGEPFAVLSLLGLVICFRRDPPALTFALSALGMLLGVILPVRFVLFRFVFIMAYSLAFFSAYSLGEAFEDRRWPIRAFAYASFGTGLIWSLLFGLDLTQQMINDSRYKVGAWMEEVAVPGDRVATADFDGPWKLPHLAEGIVTEKLPRDGFFVTELPENDPPEFVVVVPELRWREEGEEYLSPEVFRGLKHGYLGYQLALEYRSPAWFSRRFFGGVNPPVWVFVREDLVDRIPSARSGDVPLGRRTATDVVSMPHR